MNQLIYVEGPDCSGKTTLIKQIKKPNDNFYHNGVYNTPQEAWLAYKQQVFHYEQTKEMCDTILDRGPIAEQIYGSVMRQRNMITPMINDLIIHLSRVDCILILCLPPLMTVLDKWSNRLEQEYVQDTKKIKQIYNLYESVLEQSEQYPFEVVHYDYTKTPSSNNSK